MELNFNNCDNNMKIEITAPPTYLREFFVDDEIILVYEMKDTPADEGNSPIHVKTKLVKTENDESNTALDLTGNPLKVDLGGDESFGSCGKSVKANHWSTEESRHFPCTLKTARAYLNKRNRMKMCNEENQKVIYVVCDGCNPLPTVLLGEQICSDSIMTTVVNIIGYYPKGHEAISLENMEIEHIKHTRARNPKIKFLVKFKYYLYGTIIQNGSKAVYPDEHHGSVSVEATCNKCVLDIAKNSSGMKMVVKIISGHNLSSVYFLWEELCLLQGYLDILSDDQCNDENTVISNVPSQEDDIYKCINHIIVSNLMKRAAINKFSLTNIRQEHILDKLWNILKSCANLGVLRDSLHYFFEELVDADSNIKIPENDKSNIATIIKGIINGKIAVPTLSFSQALECLLELGTEKLKNDYQMIVKNFYPAEQTISSRWSKFQNEELTSQAGQRKTRITLNLRSVVIDLDNYVAKLAYLGKLHVATELIYLVKDQANIPEETFDYFCEKVYQKYIDTVTMPDMLVDLQKSPLCEFSIVLNTGDTNIIEKETPVIWVMQMYSEVRNLEITTTYHLSEYPIFPTVIYNNYDVKNVEGENKMQYFVSRLLRYKELL